MPLLLGPGLRETTMNELLEGVTSPQFTRIKQLDGELWGREPLHTKGRKARSKKRNHPKEEPHEQEPPARKQQIRSLRILDEMLAQRPHQLSVVAYFVLQIGQMLLVDRPLVDDDV